MKANLDCIPCFVRQAVEAARFLELDEEAATALMRRTLELALELDWTLPPPLMGRDVHRAIREVTGSDDPYLPAKLEATETALTLLPEIESQVRSAADPFLAAVKLAIAGNIIDLGVHNHHEIDVPRALREALDHPIDEAAVGELRSTIAAARSVLFLADNAGEIVFDRPLLELIGAEKLTVVVRGAPIINDATLDDARRSGLTSRYRVIDNGAATPGTWLEECSAEFTAEFDRAELVIAKGQGNFESLSDGPREVFFLFLAKCLAVASEVGVPKGTFVVFRAGGG
jgi:damage-control phosphatase, subfamily I